MDPSTEPQAPETTEAAAPEAPVEPELSERDRAVQAAEAAMRGEPLPTKKAPVAATPDSAPAEPEKPADPKIAVVMRARRQAQAIREQAERELQEERAKIAQERARWSKEMEELAPFREVLPKLREGDVEGLQRLGIDPRTFFRQALDRPEKLSETEMIRRELQALKEERAEERRQEQERARRYQEEQRVHTAQQAERAFAHHVNANGEKFPVLQKAYEDDMPTLIQKADRVASEYHEKTGEWASFDDICEYLETIEVKRLERLRGIQKQESQVVAPQAARAGTKTLSTTAASQKATAPKPFSQMTEAEKREHAIRAAEQAVQAR